MCVCTLELSQARLTAQGWSKIGQLKESRELDVTDSNTDDEDLKFLTIFDKLKTLSLPWTLINGSGLRHVGKVRNLRIV